MDLKRYYQERLEENQVALEAVKRKILHISLLRVGWFVGGCIALWYFHACGGWAIGGILLAIFIPFLTLMKVHNRLFHRKDYLEASIRSHQGELAALEGHYEAYEDGAEWTDASHPYTLDLDVFGPHSLFQAINRTCTSFGKATLARWLQHHLTEKAAIEERQEAVCELAGLNDFRERFRVTGMLFKGEKCDVDSLKKWIDTPGYFSRKRWSKVVCWTVPAVNLVLLVLGLCGILSMNCFWSVFTCFVVASSGLNRKVTALQSGYDKSLKVLYTYIQLIQLTDRQEMKSPLLNALKQRFASQGEKAADVLKALSTELDRLDLRNNLILYFLLEGGLFWQLRQMLRIEQWKERYGGQLMEWLDALGELDALCTFGTFAFNHPSYSYPQLTDMPFTFRAKDMGHPLMPTEQCVTNDADIPTRPYFIIITGANMAGKSTYLRTIGCNYLLACVGLPVCCTSLTLYPAQLMTSLRTSDSLTNNESYFFAELKRLKEIIDRLNSGEKMFIILDEILKGTNSTDKQKGSFALVQQLMTLKANGIIATHDLLLGELAKHFPNEIRNFCFEADIRDNELTFSYKLREGIAQNMNACFLMKKMGLVIND